MEVQHVVRLLQKNHTASLAYRILLHYNDPLLKKEARELLEFRAAQQEQLAAGQKVEDLPEELRGFAERPHPHGFHPIAVVLCVVGAAKTPQLPHRLQRLLQKVLLPLVETQTPLSLHEWAAALQYAMAQLPHQSSRVALRCLEQLVLLATHTVVVDGGRVRGVPRKADPATAPKVREQAAGDVRLVWLRALSLVATTYAAQHAQSSKRARAAGDDENKTCNACFLRSSIVRRLRRVVAAASAEAPAAATELAAVFAKLPPADQAAVRIVVAPSWAPPAAAADLIALIKSKPAAVTALLGGRHIPAGALAVAAAPEVLQHALYNMGLTSVTQEMFLDYVAVLRALPAEAVLAYLTEKGKDAVVSLFTPFVTHARVLTAELAATAVGPAYADLLRVLHAAAPQEVTTGLLPLLRQAIPVLLTTRCRSPPEKAVVLQLLADMLVVLDAAELTAQLGGDADIQSLLSRDIGSPAEDSAAQALRLATVLHVSAAALADGMEAALRNAKKEDAIRRALLVQLDPAQCSAAVATALAEPLLADCETVEVVRADAFLAFGLALVHPVLPKKLPALAQLLGTAEVLSQFNMQQAAERTRVASVAIALAQAGHCRPLAMLLTHPSGLLRQQLAAYVAAAKDAAAATAVWEALTATVFSLGQDRQEPIFTGGSAVDAVRHVLPAVLEHVTAADIASATLVQRLAEALLCFGHDYVQGADPTFFTLSRETARRHNHKAQQVDTRLFTVLVKQPYGGLLSQKVQPLLEALSAALMAVGREHVATAAARGAVLLLTATTATASQVVFVRLLELLKTSAAYFTGLDDRDRAVAAESADVLSDYEERYLRAQQLLKTYPDKPPKGMTEDDFRDVKKKDALALAKGREALHAEIAKRQRAVLPAARPHKMPYLAVRLIGTHGRFDIAGVAVLLPYLQEVLHQHVLAESPATGAPLVLQQLALDALVGLLSHTALRTLAEVTAVTAARLQDEKTLTVRDVGQITALAQLLRLALPQMLPAPLFVALTPFARVAFKAGRGSNAVSTTIPVATQHQLMSVLLQNLGQASLPAPTRTLELLSMILTSFPALYKSVQQGMHLLMSLIPMENLATVEAGMFSAVDSVREVTAAALPRFAHFTECRRALVLAAIFARDSSHNISKAVQVILDDSNYGWSLEPADWEDVLYFLRMYGQRRTNALLIVQTMQTLFERPDTTEARQEAWTRDVTKVGGLASVLALQELSPTYKSSIPAIAMDHLATQLEQPTASEALMKCILSAGRVVLRDAELEAQRRMAPELQARLAKPPKDASATQKEQYLATATVWLTIISCRLQETELLEAIIEQQSRILNNSQSAMVHRCVCESMIEISKSETVRGSPKLDDFVDKCMKQVMHSGSYVKKKAHAAGLVGVLQGLGLASLRRYHIVETIEKAATEKQTEKSGAMMLIEALCDVMGTPFEPYALHVSNLLLASVADADQKISDCADDASRVFMSCLSGVGLRQLIPKLIESLSGDVAKKKVPPLNFIGYVAFCSPKQLAATLPQIMKHINACLFDVNSSVSQAAFHALKRVAGVVSNPEIQEHVDLILNAMRSPSTEIEPALDALLYTRFVNVVDPASLALIIPVISRGLSAQTNAHTRPKAAQIAAAMVSLVSESSTLTPYAEELVRLLEEASQDPQPESRTTAAKAIGALTAALRDSIADTVVSWCFATMERITAVTIEKAGAAQVFVEVVHACGDELLELYFDTIESGMTDSRPPVREGFLYIMVYAPSTLSTESFQRLLPLSFPWVLHGLSHFSDKVRDVALVAGDSIISLYGTRHLNLVLEPLLAGVVSEMTTLRQSSLLLLSKLVLHLVAHVKKKMRVQQALESVEDEQQQEELEMLIAATEGADAMATAAADDDNGGMLVMESARDVEKRGYSLMASLEDMIGADNLCRVLSAVYCGRHEASVQVRNDTNMAWQAAVASIRAAIKKIFDPLTGLLVHFASSDNPDCVLVAEKTIEFTSRMNETIELFVNMLCDMYKTESRRTRLGALNCLAAVAQLADVKKLGGLGGRIVDCVRPGMQDSDEAVQEAARRVFTVVTKILGSRLVESAVEAQIDTSVAGLIEVVKVKPNVALPLIFKMLNARPTHTELHVEFIDAVFAVEEAEEELQRYLGDIAKLLLSCIVEGLEGATDTMQRFVEMLPTMYEDMPIELCQKTLRISEKRHGGLLATVAFGLGTTIANPEGIAFAFRAVIDCLGDESAATREEAVRSVPLLIESIEERVTASLSPEDQQDATTCKRTCGRYLLQFLSVFHETLPTTARAVISAAEPKFKVLADGEPKLFDVLMALYNRGLDYGTPQQKTEAAECIQDLLDLAPVDICAAAANTIAGRCSKVLFTRNDGSVVLALVQLCLQIMKYPAGGKEKMVEGTMALATFNAALCDSGEARALTLRIVILLLERSEKYADLILGTVVAKKQAVDSPLLRTVLCRFISTVIRYAHFEKALPHITRLVDMVRPIFDAAESRAQTAASGVAMGALCSSASVTDSTLSDLKERALAMAGTKGVQALGGYALIYSLLTAAVRRVDGTFVKVAAELVSAAAALAAPDKLTSMWMLRAGAALARTKQVPASVFKPDNYLHLLRVVNAQDEQMMSTAEYFCEMVEEAYPEMAERLFDVPRAPSSTWVTLGHFDADLEDELVADVTL